MRRPTPRTSRCVGGRRRRRCCSPSRCRGVARTAAHRRDRADADRARVRDIALVRPCSRTRWNEATPAMAAMVTPVARSCRSRVVVLRHRPTSTQHDAVSARQRDPPSPTSPQVVPRDDVDGRERAPDDNAVTVDHRRRDLVLAAGGRDERDRPVAVPSGARVGARDGRATELMVTVNVGQVVPKAPRALSYRRYWIAASAAPAAAYIWVRCVLNFWSDFICASAYDRRLVIVTANTQTRTSTRTNTLPSSRPRGRRRSVLTSSSASSRRATRSSCRHPTSPAA